MVQMNSASLPFVLQKRKATSMNKENYHNLISELAESDAKLIAVSKVHPAEKIQKAYDWGHRDFGENRAQEMQGKAEELPKDIRWHMIGPLQSNKVKYIADFVYMVHSVDRAKIARELNKRAKKANRKIKVLLQLHIAQEEQKFGFDEDKLMAFFKNKPREKYENLIFSGLMGMATFTDNENQIRREFEGLRSLFENIKQKFDLGAEFTELSMGMSGDYPIALECGATMVRIGSKVFGPRPK